MLGNGDGTFRQAGIYSGFSFGGIGDFDGDGLLDVAAVAWQGNYSYSNFVIFHGNGDGTLQQGNTYNAIPLPQSHANYEMVGEFLSSAVDLNGDGKLDLLAEDCVLTGNGDGTFNRIPRARSNLRLLDSYMADFNGDGNPDVLVEADNNDNPPYFAVFYGNGDGTFSSENALDSKNADWMMIGDFNNDGRLDLNPSILQVGISPAAVLSSTSINFAAEPIGSISPSQKVTLTSSGNAPLTIQLIEATGDFGETNNCPLNTAIPVGYSCSVSVTFTPTQFGLRIGTVTFQDNAANSPQTVSLSGVGISPTTTLLGSSSNPSAFGQTVTFKASVTSQSSGTPTGTVTFTNGSTAMCNGVTLSGGIATCTYSTLPVGSDIVTATYSGDSNFSGSSGSVSQTINKTIPTTTLTSSLNPSGLGQPVTFTAQITPQYGGQATGTVTFKDGSTPLGSTGVSGNAASLTTSGLALGTHSVNAIYSGDSNFTGSTSNTVTQVVQGPYGVVSPTTVNFGVVKVGQTSKQQIITLKNTGTAQLVVSDISISGYFALPVNKCAAGVKPGTHCNVYVTFTPHAAETETGTLTFRDNASNSPQTVSLTGVGTDVTATVTTLASSPNPSVQGQAVTFTAVVVPAPPGGETVSFMKGKTVVGTGTLSGGSAEFVTSTFKVGTTSLTAVYGGDSQFARSTSKVLKQVVKKASE